MNRNSKITKPNMNTKRNGNIELLRIIFCLLIVFSHSGMGGNTSQPLVSWGFIGVEFFYIITGYYLSKNVYENYIFESDIKYTDKDIFYDTVMYTFSRIKKLYPAYLLSCFIGFIIRWYASEFNISSLINILISLPGDLLFLQMFYIPSISLIGVLWYLSALFFAIFLIYPLLRKHYYTYVRLCPVIFLSVLGILQHTHGSIGSITDWAVIIWSDGVIRAIGDISIGCFIYQISSELKRFSNSSRSVWLYTIIEMLLYVIIFLAILNGNSAQYGVYTGTLTIIIAIEITIITSGVSILYGKFDNPVILWGGRFSSYLFMNHVYWFNFEKQLFETFKLSPSVEKLLCLVCSIVTSLIIQLIVECLILRFKFKKTI